MGEEDQKPIPELTVSERILIHLFDHNRSADDYTRPIAVTQEGIAAAIGARRSHISYCLKELDERSFISECLKHIEGGTRRRKAYSLTPEGVNNAMDLRRSLLELRVPTPTGESALGDILKKDDVKSSMTEIIRQVRDTGTFDPELRPSGMGSGKGKARNVFFAGAIEGCPDFTGRKDEIENIIEWLTSPGGRIYVVHGMAGIGKTSLGYQVSRRARSERNVFWHTCEEWTTSRSVAASLGDFLERMGDGALKNYLKDRLQLDLVEVLHILENGCRTNKTLLVLDDVQKATHELKQMVRMLVRLAEGELDVKLLVLSRTMPSIYRTRDVIIGNTVLEVQLEGLPREDVTSLLEKWGIGGDSTDGSTVEKIYRVTKGHPLAMELVRNRPVEEDGLRDITRFFRDEVLRNLSREEEDMLSLASLFRASAPDRGLFLEALAPEGDQGRLRSA